MAYAFWVHKNAMPKNWLMQVKGLKRKQIILKLGVSNLHGHVDL